VRSPSTDGPDPASRRGNELLDALGGAAHSSCWREDPTRSGPSGAARLPSRARNRGAREVQGEPVAPHRDTRGRHPARLRTRRRCGGRGTHCGSGPQFGISSYASLRHAAVSAMGGGATVATGRAGRVASGAGERRTETRRRHVTRRYVRQAARSPARLGRNVVDGVVALGARRAPRLADELASRRGALVG